MLVVGKPGLLVLMPGTVDEVLSSQTETKLCFLKHSRLLWPHNNIWPKGIFLEK